MNSSFASLSAKQLRRAAGIKDKIDSLQQKLNRLLGQTAGNAVAKAKIPSNRANNGTSKGTRNKRRFSASARAKMAAAAKARWAKAKSQGKTKL